MERRRVSPRRVAAAVLALVLALLVVPTVSTAAAPTPGGRTVPATVNVRAKASTASGVVAAIPANTRVDFQCWVKGQTITDYWGGRNAYWHKISYGNKTGYIADGMVVTGTNGPLSGESKCGTTSKPGGKTVPAAVNLRARATTASGVVVAIPANTRVTFQCWAKGQTITDYWGGRNAYWHKVNYGNKTGYIADGVVVTGTNGPLSGEAKCSTAVAPTSPTPGSPATCSGRPRGDHSCLRFSGFDKWADRYENPRLGSGQGVTTNAYGAILDRAGHNCVGYVAYRLKQRSVSYFAPVHAKNLHTYNTSRNGWTASSTPRVGDLAQHSRGSYGHVAYVEAVYSNGQILISESNWAGTDAVRRARVSEFDRFLRYAGRGSDTVQASSSGPTQSETPVEAQPVTPTPPVLPVPPDPAPEPASASGETLGQKLAGSRYANASGIEGSTVRLYAAVFLRVPDSSGFAYWTDSGRSTTSMAHYFVTGPEFQSRYGTLANRAFVDILYRNVLGREADGAGANFWVNKLDTGMTRAHVVVGFSESVEFRIQTHTS